MVSLKQRTGESIRSQQLNKRSKWGQCCYYLLVSILISCSLAITAGNLKLYFSNAVKNSIITNSEKLLDFPAITICNQLIAKRVPTCDFPGSGYIWRYFALLSKSEGLWNKKSEDEFAKFCPCPNNYKKRSMEQVLQNFNSHNFYKILKEYCPSIDDQFAFCQLLGNPLNCSDIFSLRQLDIGLCATFNEMRFAPIVNHISDLGDFGGLFGASKIGGIQHNQSGIHSGLSIVLKVNKKEYCGNSRKWSGVGFHYSIQQPSKPIPLYVLSHFYRKLHAGYIFDVVIKITNIIRHTAHMGRCVNRYVMLPGMGSSGVPFDKSVCLLSCLARLIYIECGCMTRALDSLDLLFTTENVDLEYINISTPRCRMTTEMESCDSKHVMLLHTEEFILTFCPRCSPVCIESEYSTTVTSKKLRSVPAYMKIDNSVDDLIVANFFVDSSLVTTIHENPAFTAIDLIIYVGSIFSLFFGISYILVVETVFKVFLYVNVTLIPYILKICGFNKH